MIPRLRAAVKQNRLPHANLLVGGSENDALELASAYNCLSGGARPCGECLPCVKVREGNHPDVSVFGCAQAKVEQIRALTANAQTLPNEGRYKVCVLLEADGLSPICQNALLKTLEEPPKSTVFILTAESLSPLLPTVRSRLTAWYAGAGQDLPPMAEPAEKILAAYDGADELNLLLAALSCDKHTRDEAGALIDSLRAGLLERRALSAAEKLGEIRLTLVRNAGVGHVFGAVAAVLAEDFNSHNRTK